MIGKTGFTLFGAALLFTTSAFSSQDIRLFASKGYSFKPGETISLENPVIFSMNFKCTMHTVGMNNMEVIVKEKSVTVNGHKLSKGEKLVHPVSEGTTMRFSADGRASVDLTNRGQTVVEADCSLG